MEHIGNQTTNRKMENIIAIIFMVILGIMANGCGGGGSSSPTDPTNPTVEAPGVPTNFTVEDTVGQILSATLNWSSPVSGGEVETYEIYRSTTVGSTFSPDNHLISLPHTTTEFIDNAGLERNTDTYWVVTAKNSGGETPTTEVLYVPSGGAGGEVVGFGNNFSAAMIFADGYGLTGSLINGVWTKTVADLDYNTGLRPNVDEVLPEGTTLAYLDPDTTHTLNDTTYYKQKTASTWQGEWKSGVGEEQNVSASFGDNLVSQTLTTSSIVRIETVLRRPVDTNMTSYNMVSLYGEKYNEIYGTDGVEYNNTTAFVFATNAHLKIQAVDGEGVLGTIIEDQAILDSEVPDGPGKFGAEINVAGNLTYGYVWDLKQNTVPAGTYRITFSLDAESAATGAANNTFITSSPNGVVDSESSVHIDVVIH